MVRCELMCFFTILKQKLYCRKWVLFSDVSYVQRIFHSTVLNPFLSPSLTSRYKLMPLLCQANPVRGILFGGGKKGTVTKTTGVHRTRAVCFVVIPFLVCAHSKVTSAQMHQALPIFRMCKTNNSVLMNMSLESSSLFRLLLPLLQRN